MPQQHRSKIIAAIVAILVIVWMGSGISVSYTHLTLPTKA